MGNMIGPFKPKKIIHLQPGELLVSKEAIKISTILGSCVAVCLWDKKKRIGGMNHIILPRTEDDNKASTKYGNVATIILYETLKKRGCLDRDIRTRFFGGASGLSLASKGSITNVGEKNIEITRKVLKKLNLKVTGEDLGGHTGRKITFDIETGVIQLQYLRRFDFKSEGAVLSDI